MIETLTHITGFVSEITQLLNGFGVGNLIHHLPLPHVGVGGGVEAKESVDVVSTIKFTIIFVAGIGAIFGLGLAFAAKKFSVKMDPKVEQVRDILAGAQCGGCGFAGCQQYAEAVVERPEVSSTLCTPGGAHVAELVALITGKKAEITEPKYSTIMCQGGLSKAIKKFNYEGVKDCRAAVLAGGGDKSCAYGCLGYGTCTTVCPFDAIHMGSDALPVVDRTKCTGCGLCALACPKKVIEILPGSKAVQTACHSKDRGTDTRKSCQIGCIACGMCEKVCPFNAAEVKDNLSRINIDKCKVCGLCVIKCPTKAIVDFLPARPKAFIVESKCIGCNMCMKVCPVNAAHGQLKQKHSIDVAKCIGCGICTAKCPVQAIEGTFNFKEVFEKAQQKKKANTEVSST
ncbi:MAG: RnfABCDGE type electron transport complex subunit B [Nitrospirae bacterium]|nr:RnfABCDGE type electron transport complex subunit B [Nitrospirota bacterium]